MKMKKSLFFVSMFGLFLAFLFIFMPQTQLVNAATATTSPPETTTSSTTYTPRSLTISGLTSSDAKVTDMNGTSVQPSDNMYTWMNYEVNYNWSIPDGVQINSGDTTTFELPEGLVANGDLSFPIYNSSSTQIGTATIKNGESSGTLTFNDVLSNTDANRNGTLTLISKGTNTGTGNEGENWMFNKIGWISGYDQNNVPDELTWNIAFNPNLHNLSNVVITDTLGPNQEYIPDSLTAIGGSYGQGGFVSNGQQMHPTVTTNGNQIIISFPGNVTTAVDIYYRVKLTNTSSTGPTTWTNHATMGSSEGDYQIDSSTSWGGAGTGNGDQNVGTVTLTKTDATTNQPLSGAEYELADSKGNVIISNGTTDDNGQLAIKNLPYGSYTLTEVRAPDGYQLNSEPISFTIPDNGVINLNLTQADNGENGAVLLKKIDPDSKDSIAGTTFNLLDSSGNVIKENLVTDGNGEIAVDNLPAGDYSFVETQPSAGYELNTTPINFTVIAGQTTPVDLEKFNVAVNVIPDTGNVVLTKLNATFNEALPGAVFDLLDSNGKVIQSNLVTDENGQINISNLEAGNYSFVEVAAPEGYELDQTPIEFTVSKGSTNNVEAKDKEIYNEPGVVTPPTTNPSEPGATTPPTTNPSEPGVTTPPTTSPEIPDEPGVVTPPTTNPSEPGVTTPPITSPEIPGEPGVVTPPTTNPSEPGVTTPPITSPETPSEVIPPEYSENSDTNNTENSQTEYPSSVLPPFSGNNSLSENPTVGINGLPSGNSSTFNKKTFPQTGNDSGLFMAIIGLFIALFITLRYLIKKLSY